MFKKILIAFLSVSMLLCSTTAIFAESKPTFSLSEYNQLKNAGYIGDDVSFEDLKQCYDDSKELEKQLEESNDFSIIPFATNTLRAGDMLITNSTSSSGIVGHAAIALNSTEILHIAGPGKSVTIVSPSKFRSLYNSGWIKVYRPNSSTAGSKAASWASKTYRGSNAVYKITTNLATTNETYCSKIVWQAYFFGVGRNVVDIQSQTTYGIRPPYVLPSVLSSGDYTMNLKWTWN